MNVLPQRFDLGGDDWQLKGYIGEDWRWRDAHLPETRDAPSRSPAWIRATVPGSVHHDLWQAGQIPDPYHGQNTLLCEWVSARTWLYRKRFAVDEALQGQRLQLCFEGVDFEATFYLNGHQLGAHRSMFTPATFDVDRLLNYGEDNVLAVVLEPAPPEQPQVGRTSLVRTHKTRMNYWWDFCPRLVHLGLWDDVYLQASGPVRIEEFHVRPLLNDDFSEAVVQIRVTLSAASQEMVTLQMQVAEGNQPVVADETRHLVPIGQSTYKATLTLSHPRLWWPNGYGAQSLYELDVTAALDPDHAISDQQSLSFGVRHIEFWANEDAPAKARPYTLTVNGRKIYIKGWNWVPMDLLYGVERPQKRERLLTLAQQAHVNMLRVWGGGLIEKEAFYRLCDRLGILVWQEFIQSSSGIGNTPPTDNEFQRMMQREAQGIIPRRRNHPSLAIWCGGNELQDPHGRPLGDDHPLLALLQNEVRAHDPDRHWLPTSPTGPLFGQTLENVEAQPDDLHDVHGPWIYEGLEEQYRLFNESTSLLNSEFGVEGITNPRTLNATVPREKQRPIRRANPVWHHLGAWWIWEEHWDNFWGGLTERPTPVVVRAVQLLQAEGLRYAVEANRRRKFHNSGSLPWQFNEPYPMAACTSAVDYYAQPKPVYHAVARAYAPLLVSARFARLAWAGEDEFKAQIWVNYSGLKSLPPLILQVRLVTGDGEVCLSRQHSVTVPGNAAARLTGIQMPLADLGRDLFFLDLALCQEDGEVVAHNRYPFSRAATLAPLLELPSTALQVDKATGDDKWQLTIANDGQQAALGVWLEAERELRAPGYVYYSDNHFHLLPGEQRQIRARWDGIAPAERSLTIQCWNAKEHVVYG